MKQINPDFWNTVSYICVLLTFFITCLLEMFFAFEILCSQCIRKHCKMVLKKLQICNFVWWKGFVKVTCVYCSVYNPLGMGYMQENVCVYKSYSPTRSSRKMANRTASQGASKTFDNYLCNQWHSFEGKWKSKFIPLLTSLPCIRWHSCILYTRLDIFLVVFLLDQYFKLCISLFCLFLIRKLKRDGQGILTRWEDCQSLKKSRYRASIWRICASFLHMLSTAWQKCIQNCWKHQCKWADFSSALHPIIWDVLFGSAKLIRRSGIKIIRLIPFLLSH